MAEVQKTPEQVDAQKTGPQNPEDLANQAKKQDLRNKLENKLEIFDKQLQLDEAQTQISDILSKRGNEIKREDADRQIDEIEKRLSEQFGLNQERLAEIQPLLTSAKAKIASQLSTRISELPEIKDQGDEMMKRESGDEIMKRESGDEIMKRREKDFNLAVQNGDIHISGWEEGVFEVNFRSQDGGVWGTPFKLEDFSGISDQEIKALKLESLNHSATHSGGPARENIPTYYKRMLDLEK